eukprot:m.152848 g.152848  ORF g.152848 m.152848 type:complete len:169 (-) comp17896_c0_seq1:143-649(-)
MSRIGDYKAKPDPLTGYRDPSTTYQQINRWGFQVLHWVLCAAAARGIDFGILYGGADQLARVATGIGWWACTEKQVDIKQWLNIMVFPIIIDCVQFLVQNYFLKNRALLAQETEARSRRQSLGGDEHIADAAFMRENPSTPCHSMSRMNSESSLSEPGSEALIKRQQP